MRILPTESCRHKTPVWWNTFPPENIDIVSALETVPTFGRGPVHPPECQNAVSALIWPSQFGLFTLFYLRDVEMCSPLLSAWREHSHWRFRLSYQACTLRFSLVAAVSNPQHLLQTPSGTGRPCSSVQERTASSPLVGRPDSTDVLGGNMFYNSRQTTPCPHCDDEKDLVKVHLMHPEITAGDQTDTL